MNDSDMLVMRRVKAGISRDSSAFSVTKKDEELITVDRWSILKIVS